MARGYVRFAAERSPLFDTVFGAGIDKSRHPEVHRAEEPVEEAFSSCVRAVCGGDEVAAAALETAVQATAHGFASLLLDGAFGSGEDAVRTAADQAAAATLALIGGRDALG